MANTPSSCYEKDALYKVASKQMRCPCSAMPSKSSQPDRSMAEPVRLASGFRSCWSLRPCQK